MDKLFYIPSTIIGLILVLLFQLIKREIFAKTYYSHRWKKSSSFKLKDFLKERRFNTYYYQQPEYKLITNNINKEKSVLIIGSPLSGKTRAAYQALINSRKSYDVLVPKNIDINPETFLIPNRITIWRPKIIFIDDLHRFVEQKNFETLLEDTIRECIPVIATCRSEIEYIKTEKIMLEKNISLERFFNNEIVELKKISESTAKEITKEVAIAWSTVKFNGTIGSIFMPFSEMRARFSNCSNEEKTIMRSLKLLYISGIYNENQMFPIKWLKLICKKYGLEKNDFTWDDLLRELRKKELLNLEDDSVFVEETYLENIVTMKTERSNLAIFEEMVSTYKGNSVALFKLGNRAYEVGLLNMDIKKYRHIAIDAYNEILIPASSEQSSSQYIATQNNLSVVYRELAEIENKPENCKKAILAAEKTLALISFKESPWEYGMAQFNLGTAHGSLAEIENKLENSKKAIAAFKEALRVRTIKRFPPGHAVTQNNIGNAYKILAEVEDKTKNCKKAIKVFNAALKIRTFEHFPFEYGMTQNNIGTAYATLAEIEDKAENTEKAVVAFKEALKSRSRKQFPLQYGTTQSNIGIAYKNLAAVEDTAENCRKAIQAFEKSLAVCTQELSPTNYGITQNNISNAYVTLAKVEDKSENCEKAIQASKEALKIFNKKEFPDMHNVLFNNLRLVMSICEDRE